MIYEGSLFNTSILRKFKCYIPLTLKESISFKESR